MIAPDELIPGQTYYLAGYVKPLPQVYVGPYPSGTSEHPSFVFSDENKRHHRVFAVELTDFHADPADCWRAIIATLTERLGAATAHLNQLETNS